MIFKLHNSGNTHLSRKLKLGKKIFGLFLVGFLGGIGLVFAASTIWNTTNIPEKNITDGVMYGEFNTLIQTTKGLYHNDGGSLADFTDDKFGLGVANPSIGLDVNGAVRAGGTMAVCNGGIAGTLRYNSTSKSMELCNGTSWRSFSTCTSLTCSSQGFTCGTQSDGCGETLDCGTCASGSVCSNGTCVAVACSANAECNDGNLCTTDTCTNPGTASAACSNVNNSVTQACTASLGTCTNTGVKTCSGGYLGACSATTPVPSTWTPATSTVCSGTSFTQTSNCGTTRSATGTKACNTTYSPVLDLVGNKIWHFEWSGQWVYAISYCRDIKGHTTYESFTTATTSGTVCRCDTTFGCSGESCTTGKAYYTSITCQ